MIQGGSSTYNFSCLDVEDCLVLYQSSGLTVCSELCV